jgi:integrase
MPATPARAYLSKQTVDAAEPGVRRYIVWDDALSGFGLRVEPSGLKTYVVRYRQGGGRRGLLRQFKLGTHGKLTPDQARKAAKLKLAEAELGADPQASRVAARAELTMGELCELYMREGVDGKKDSTLKLDRIRIDRHIKPRLGRIKVSDVTHTDLQRLVRDISAGKIKGEATPHTRGGPGAAARTAGLLGGIFSFAIKLGMRPDNPARLVERPKDRRRERFLSMAELGALGDALEEAARTGAKPAYVAIIRLLALTGARKNEIARLKWSEVDFEQGYIRLGDSKTGPRKIPLGGAAAELLSRLPQKASKWVFPDPAAPKEPIRGLDWAWVTIRRRAALDDVSIHDLRHSFASAGIASGQGLPLIAKMLGHRHVQTTARYAHLADDPVREAADRVATKIEDALGQRTAGGVVQLHVSRKQ